MADVDIARITQLGAVPDSGRIHHDTGETDIDTSEDDYTTDPGGVVITIEAVSDMFDARITLDLDKDTTGFGAVFGAATGTWRLAYSPAAANYRPDTQPDLTLNTFSGTNAAVGRGVTFPIGLIAAGDTVRVYVDLSAETGDCEIPYAVDYVSDQDAIITPVAAA